MQNINKTLKGQIKKYKLEDKVKGYEVLKYWEEAISKILPDAVQKTLALSFEKGVLRVASLSREIALEIKLFAKRLIYELNGLLGKELVYAIYCEC